MENFISSLVAGLISGSVISTVLGVFLHRRAKSIEVEIKNQYDRSLAIGMKFDKFTKYRVGGYQKFLRYLEQPNLYR